MSGWHFDFKYFQKKLEGSKMFVVFDVLVGICIDGSVCFSVWFMDLICLSLIWFCWFGFVGLC